MNRIILKSLLFIFFLSVNINAQNISINKVDSVRLENNIKLKNREFTSKDSVSDLINNTQWKTIVHFHYLSRL